MSHDNDKTEALAQRAVDAHAAAVQASRFMDAAKYVYESKPTAMSALLCCQAWADMRKAIDECVAVADAVEEDGMHGLAVAK